VVDLRRYLLWLLAHHFLVAAIFGLRFNCNRQPYWKPGSRYYGKPKQGEYMSEEEAVKKD
jgi:hypothetical protein